MKYEVRRNEETKQFSNLQTSDFRLQKGFTVIELLTVIVIIGILAAIVLVNYQSGQKKLALQRSATKLASDIRKVQEMAMSLKECPAGTGCAGQTPKGYGVLIEPNFSLNCNPGEFQQGRHYCLYANMDNNNDNDKTFDSSDGDVIIETITLEKQVFICWVPANNNYINFTPPDPEVMLNDDSTITSLTIILGLSSSSCPTDKPQVKVNKIGLIEIID